MNYLENAKKLKTQIDANQLIVDTVNAAGGIWEELEQSDKLGFDWRVFYVNDIAVKKVYVEQTEPFGTADNPIIWKEGMSLIPNAYYIHEGIRKVWMGEAGPWRHGMTITSLSYRRGNIMDDDEKSLSGLITED